ncbi:hypothetical protein, partial [Rheinheimera sp.]|uniref:hypothetical protein n=1 Tax=Rheinheimera sp. TaxID=1869214 RepID=UPI00260B3ECB
VNIFIFDAGFFHPIGSVFFIAFGYPHRLYSSKLIRARSAVNKAAASSMKGLVKLSGVGLE